jgi:hypothetical protein
MPSLSFSFTYYDSAEVDCVIVKEISPAKKDTITLLVKAEYRESYRGTPREKIWIPSWELKKEIPLENEYLIIVNDEAPHLIRKFKMEPHPQCDMTACYYVPILSEYEIDGKVDKGWGITIRKK